MGKKAAAPKLEMPVVPDGDVEAARKALQDADEKRRQNSNMHYYLQSIGKKNAYELMTAAEKKEFFLKWFAKKVSDGTTVSSSSNSVFVVAEKGNDFEWMSKETMEKRLGEKKAAAKILSGTLGHRPDPDTKLDDEWSREYKVYFGKGAELERSENKHSLDTSQEVTGDRLKEAIEDMSAAMAHTAGEKPVCTVHVKKEPQDNGGGHVVAMSIESKTYEALQKNARAVLRNCGDTIVTIKTMFQATQDLKYGEALHADISKLLPKFRSHYTNLEKIITTDGTVDDAVFLALGKKLDAEYEKFNEYAEWYGRLTGNKGAKRQKKA